MAQAQQVYRIISGSAAEAFHLSRAKIRLYGGGFANGKTTGAVALALLIARDYPGCSILIARETYPKLNTTIRREFIKWCPPQWIKSFDKTKDNTCTLVNGTVIDFRYIDSRDGSDGTGTSNLLSANYDLIIVDQIDDPGITENDFNQLLGRLRGSTPYVGDDATMPRTGPRWLVLTCNPTLGWPYSRIVKPLHDLRNGVINPDLLCERDADGNMVLDAHGRPKPIVEVFEATTYENAQNVPEDYIRTLQNTYTGKMRDRYLLGKWVAFEGVVYDEFDDAVHMVPREYILEHLRALRDQGYMLTPVEGYDHGIAVPSCYLLGFTDDTGTLHITEGFYEPGLGVDDQAKRIKALRNEARKYVGFVDYGPVIADPQIFKRTSITRGGVAPTIAQMFYDAGVEMVRGNNNIINGIVRVKQRLIIQQSLINPYSGAIGAPRLFINNELRFVAVEYSTYRWKSQGVGETRIDEPVDKDDHAMDVIKYMCSRDTPAAARIAKRHSNKPPTSVMRWSESAVSNSIHARSHRYAS